MSNVFSYSDDELALYNPAYLGYLLYSSIREYNSASGRRFSSNLSFLVIPLSVNKIFYSRLPSKTTTSLDKWIGENDGYLVLFSKLAESFIPAVVDALEFLALNGLIDVDINGDINIINGNLPMTSALFNKSEDMKQSLRASKFLGKWFSFMESDVTVFAKFGVQP
ncbi:TPA: hypothetical protein RI793_003473 [Vibrio cholerae]|nr:hypothetical protein [Vibrio cholerae]